MCSNHCYVVQSFLFYRSISIQNIDGLKYIQNFITIQLMLLGNIGVNEVTMIRNRIMRSGSDYDKKR